MFLFSPIVDLSAYMCGSTFRGTVMLWCDSDHFDSLVFAAIVTFMFTVTRMVFNFMSNFAFYMGKIKPTIYNSKGLVAYFAPDD